MRRTYGKRSKEQSPPRPVPASCALGEGAEAAGGGGGGGGEEAHKRGRLEGGGQQLLASSLASVGRMRAQLEEFSYQVVRLAGAGARGLAPRPRRARHPNGPRSPLPSHPLATV